jgi:hypothetical protein
VAERQAVAFHRDVSCSNDNQRRGGRFDRQRSLVGGNNPNNQLSSSCTSISAFLNASADGIDSKTRTSDLPHQRDDNLTMQDSLVLVMDGLDNGTMLSPDVVKRDCARLEDIGWEAAEKIEEGARLLANSMEKGRVPGGN